MEVGRIGGLSVAGLSVFDCACWVEFGGLCSCACRVRVCAGVVVRGGSWSVVPDVCIVCEQRELRLFKSVAHRCPRHAGVQAPAPPVLFFSLSPLSLLTLPPQSSLLVCIAHPQPYDDQRRTMMVLKEASGMPVSDDDGATPLLSPSVLLPPPWFPLILSLPSFTIWLHLFSTGKGHGDGTQWRMR